MFCDKLWWPYNSSIPLRNWTDHMNDLFLGMLIGSVAALLGCIFFVISSYPNHPPNEFENSLAHHEIMRRSYFKHFLLMISICCGGYIRRKIRKHFANDWLAGCWIIFLVCSLALFGFFVMSASAYYTSNAITNFVNVCTWVYLK
jgi:hypothetical protein